MHTLDMDAILPPGLAGAGDGAEDSDSAAEEVGQSGVHERRSIRIVYFLLSPAVTMAF